MNAFSVIGDVVNHIHRRIIRDDDPKNLMVGLFCLDCSKRWEIRTTDINSSSYLYKVFTNRFAARTLRERFEGCLFVTNVKEVQE